MYFSTQQDTQIQLILAKALLFLVFPIFCLFPLNTLPTVEINKVHILRKSKNDDFKDFSNDAHLAITIELNIFVRVFNEGITN